MKRKRVLVIVVACALMGAVALIVWPQGPKEPEYQGKSLSWWAFEAPRPYVTNRNGGMVARPRVLPADPAADAIRAMGTNALFLLVKWSDYDTPFWKQKLKSVVGRPQRGTYWLWRMTETGDARAELAANALERLGKDALPAVPEICSGWKRLATAGADVD